MTIPTISTLPTAPARTDAPATFISRADAFLGALVTMQGELNTSIGAMNTDIAGVNADATAAAASASAASTSETNAATSETNAAASAVTASDGATTVQDAVDDLQTLYLGAKASNPTLDNEGNPLVEGAMYFNTVVNLMKVYVTGSWVDAGSSVNGTLNRFNTVATSGQTTFTTNYDIGFVDVYLNGVKLVPDTDFTASNGTSIVLTTGATLNDNVEIIAFGSFQVADQLQISNNLSDVASASASIVNLGISATAAELNTLDGITASTSELNILDGVTATTTELNYTSGVTSSIQSQIDGKEPADATILKDADIGSTLLGYVAPSTTGNVLTSNGTNWTSAPAGGGGECQVWCYCTMSGSTVTLQNDVGVSSITDDGVGVFIVNLSVTRTSQYYATSASAWTGGYVTRTRPHSTPTTKIWVYFTNTSGTLTDPGFSWSMMSAGAN